MGYYVTNPSCYQGDPGNPPEWEPEDPMECAGCGEVFDAEDLNDDCRCEDCASYGEDD